MCRIRVLIRKFICPTLALACFTGQTARAQQTTLAAPVPSQIQQAQTIFLTNSGSDPNFPIDATKSYNDIYAALQTWGRYKLVNSPFSTPNPILPSGPLPRP